MDAQSKPKKVRKFEPSTPDELNMEQYAIKLMHLRKEIEDEMMPFLK
jgi:hypothetical protein